MESKDIELSKLLDQILSSLDRKPGLLPFPQRGKKLVIPILLLFCIVGVLIRFIPWSPANTIAYGMFVLAGWLGIPILIALELRGFYGMFVIPEQNYLITSFIARDRQGYTELKPYLMKTLCTLSEKEEFSGRLLVKQSFDILEKFLLHENQLLKDEALKRLLSAIREREGIAREKLIAFSMFSTFPTTNEAFNSQVRQTACKKLGNTLSRDESEHFAASQFPELRLSAISQETITRERLMQLAKEDSDPKVRQAACDRLGNTLSAEESKQLTTSAYPEVRIFALGQKNITRQQLIRLAKEDPERGVRQAACDRLGKTLSAEEGKQLVYSSHSEVRVFAINKGNFALERGDNEKDGSDRKWLLQLLAENNSDPKVRQAACNRLEKTLSTEETDQLAHSSHSEVRIFALGQKNIPRERLIRLAEGDPERSVRQAACNRLGKTLSAEESKQLTTSTYPEVRVFAINNGNFALERGDNEKDGSDRKWLLQLLAKNLSDNNIYKAVINRLKPLSDDEHEQLEAAKRRRQLEAAERRRQLEAAERRRQLEAAERRKRIVRDTLIGTGLVAGGALAGGALAGGALAGGVTGGIIFGVWRFISKRRKK